MRKAGVEDNGQLGTHSERAGTVVRVRLSGVAEEENKAFLERFLTGLRTEADGSPTSQICIDMQALEFMASSCLKQLVNWILVQRDRGIQRRYGMVFVPAPASHWQPRTLRSLCALAPTGTARTQGRHPRHRFGRRR